MTSSTRLLSMAVLATPAEGDVDMKTKLTCALVAPLALAVVLPLGLVAQTPLPTLRAIFYHNVAHILLEPELPVVIDGAAPVPAHPWYEARIFGPAGPPQRLHPAIELTTALLSARFLRPPGRIIPSPFDLGTVQFGPTPDGSTAVYRAEYPELFTPRDERNTAVLTLVDRQQSLLLRTNFDLAFDVDAPVLAAAEGTQTVTMQVTPRQPNLVIVVRLRSESTDQLAVQVQAETASPPPTNSTATSLIWTLSNPPVGEPLTLTAAVALRNVVAPAPIRHFPGLVITSSLAPQTVGTADNTERVEFPSAWLPAAFQRVTYAVSAPVNWTFETADRTLVDIRELTELVPETP
jgi:hypothetical protein